MVDMSGQIMRKIYDVIPHPARPEWTLLPQDTCPPNRMPANRGRNEQIREEKMSPPGRLSPAGRGKIRITHSADPQG
jgi:hypothetical protein